MAGFKKYHLTGSQKNALAAVVIGVALIVSWSWMLRLRMTNLTGSFFVGYILALLGFVTIVLLSWLTLWQTTRYFARRYTAKNQLSFWFLIELFVVWAAVEYVVSILVAVIWIGRGGSLDTILPFSSFTPLLAYTPLDLLGRFVGFYGVSAGFVVIIASVGLKKCRRFAVPVLLAAACLIGASWLLYRTPSGPATQAQIVANKLGDLPSRAMPNADIVLYPEYGLDYLTHEDIQTFMQSANPETFYIGSRRTEITTGAQNRLVFGSAKKGVLAERPKSRLIPAGEYLPYAAEYILKTTRSHTMLANFKVQREIQPGPVDKQPIALSDGVVVGSGICASIIAPEDYRAMTRNGATILTNSASLGIFDSIIFDVQHTGLAKFMATANARPFLQSSSDGYAFALDHNGNTMNRLKPGQALVTTHTNTKKTPYTHLGEWVAYSGLIFMAYGLLKKTYKRLHNHKRKPKTR